MENKNEKVLEQFKIKELEDRFEMRPWLACHEICFPNNQCEEICIDE